MSAYCQPSDRQIAPPGRRDPAAPAPAAAAGLVFGEHDRGAARGRRQAPRATWCWWIRASTRPAALRCARARPAGSSDCDALRRQRADARREPITLVGLRIERNAELAQLLDGLPDGGARHRQIGGQRLAGLERAVVETLEHALRQRPLRDGGAHARPRPNSHSLRARGSVPCAHAPHVAAMRVDHERRAGQRKTQHRRQHARRRAAVDRPGWRCDATIDASPTKPDTVTTASQLANSGTSRSEIDAGERADQRGHAFAAAKAVPHREHVAEDGGERAQPPAARPPASA